MAGKSGMKKSKGLKKHNKAQKEKAMTKRAAATDKSKAKNEKISMAAEKVEPVEVQETVQEYSVNKLSTSAVAEVTEQDIKQFEVATLFDNKVEGDGIVPVTTPVGVREEETDGKYMSTTLPLYSLTHTLTAALPTFKTPDVCTKHKSQDDDLFANMETPQQRFKRICFVDSASTEKIQPWDDEHEPEGPASAKRAIDDNGFESICFRIKDTTTQIAADQVSSIGQLFAMVAKNGHTSVGTSAGAKVSQPLEVIEKHHMPILTFPLSVIAEEDQEISVSPTSRSTNDVVGSPTWSAAVEESDLFSRSATPFSETAQKQKPVIYLPSPACSSPTSAARASTSSKADVESIRSAIIADSDIPFDPSTLICKITVRHNAGEGPPTREQIKAAFVFTCPDEISESPISDKATLVDPAIVSFKEKRQCDDIRVPANIVDPTIISATVKKCEIIAKDSEPVLAQTIDPAILSCKVRGSSSTPVASSQSPTTLGPYDQSPSILLQKGRSLLAAVLGIGNSDPSSRHTSHDSGATSHLQIPSPKDDSGPSTPKKAILPEYCEKEFVPAAKHQNSVASAANRVYEWPDYYNYAPGQFFHEHTYAQYQLPHMWDGGYNPQEGAPEYNVQV